MLSPLESDFIYFSACSILFSSFFGGALGRRPLIWCEITGCQKHLQLLDSTPINNRNKEWEGEKLFLTFHLFDQLAPEHNLYSFCSSHASSTFARWIREWIRYGSLLPIIYMKQHQYATTAIGMVKIDIRAKGNRKLIILCSNARSY